METVKFTVRQDRKLCFDALIIKEKWGELILSGEKRYEVRGYGMKNPRKVGLVYSGTNLCYGYVNLGFSTEVKDASAWEIAKKHCCLDIPFEKLPYKRTYLWKINFPPVRFEKPVTIERKKGQVIWIKNPKVIGV